ncbi:nitrate- and nitrite sensing domain-containing protein [Streptomyces sp. 8L]|uniref:nitrate- and nitrite sensing domain-containing protein n=1 Tax=Streptomyces sp. 8L TaxID=2877242 RepID=UPI001CD73865|nr:nitrate- and nitrite sensing domain-containing protein [Streptomyces sp. 8L]MCA1221039.1 nitrate- and nitrite sensing domain-containing protein [Streptomyces sp. 8L]
MRFRGKSIRRKIVALLLVPLISVTALSTLSGILTGIEALDLLHLKEASAKVGRPVQRTIAAVQQERLDTLIHLAAPKDADTAGQLRTDRAATDRAIAAVKAGQSDSLRASLDATAKKHLDAFTAKAARLAATRTAVDKGGVSRSSALDVYSGIVDPAYLFLSTVYGKEDAESGDGDNQGRALIGIFQAQEMFSRENALVTSALVAGELSPSERRTVSGFVADRQLLYATSLADLPSHEAAVLNAYNTGAANDKLAMHENAIATTGAMVNDRSMTAQQWRDRAEPVVAGIHQESVKADDLFQQHIGTARHTVYLRFFAATALGIVALVASVAVSVRVGRALIHDLSELRKEAGESAGVRLPSVMRRLAAGEQVDIETEAPRLAYEDHEIGQVGQALNTLQRAAVEAAVKQADLRRGVAEVFVNLARRNQVLLHRQLGLLDAMERRTEDATELADLFRLDHLTTRMRRHAEGLVILSGAVPSRQWRKPVRLMDVVRAAVAEVEDYERVEVRRLPRIGVGGPAVADLTHLLAELLENATVFSPPQTAVQVGGARTAGGFILEIHDRGLGMPPDALLEANLRLAETPEFELSDTDRLGLFVVSRLAQRQNVRVSLHPSPYGGTSAVVLLPGALLTEAPDTEPGLRLDRPGDRPGPDRPALASRAENGIRLAPAAGPAPRAPGARAAARAAAARARPAAEDRDDQHQQAGESAGTQDKDSTARDERGLPQLPRRNSPKLVADRGRRLDEHRGRPHPEQPPAASGGPGSAPGDRPESGGPAAPAQDGLPRRVRQASLAPQLRETSQPAARTGAGARATPGDDERDAEAVRARMASLQRGWQRGRHQNEAEESAGQPGAAPGGTPGTTSEGNGR